MDFGVAQLPENILNASNEALKSLIPEKSKDRNEKAYNAFKQWQGGNHIEVINENVLLAYFQQLSKKHSPSTLWVYY
ncbi:hypothetical protein NQ314_003485 [Rhamnusium bicolor]|uniref:Uncharacterized protein n=1 Tax=Rhamnusium bicolor TaxID=1586634 RepID=A0AAV8ZLM8_9CUCU|nr:hypothetical protein NQ314_003485 [Rhamnusium bicolor]